MGEWKSKLAKCEAMLMSCAGVQTVAGRVQVRWESESAILARVKDSIGPI